MRFSFVPCCFELKQIHNKIPLKKDASGPEGYSDTSGLDHWELCIVFLVCLRGVPINPKEYHVATVSWLNIPLKKKSRLALLGSLWISPLTTNERTLDTLIFQIRIFNLWWVHKNVELWYCHISILIKINLCFISWIIYLVICNFIHTQFLRHPIQMNWENML